MCQRRQVARAAERAILAHHRNDASVQCLGIGFYHHGEHAGTTGTQGGQAQEHKRADDLFLHLRSRARSMRAHQGKLQLGAHFLWNVAAGKCTKAGGDAIDRGGILCQFFHALAGRGYLFESLGRNFHLRPIAGNSNDVFDAQRTNVDGHGGWVGVRHDNLLVLDQ